MTVCVLKKNVVCVCVFQRNPHNRKLWEAIKVKQNEHKIADMVERSTPSRGLRARTSNASESSLDHLHNA